MCARVHEHTLAYLQPHITRLTIAHAHRAAKVGRRTIGGRCLSVQKASTCPDWPQYSHKCSARCTVHVCTWQTHYRPAINSVISTAFDLSASTSMSSAESSVPAAPGHDEQCYFGLACRVHCSSRRRPLSSTANCRQFASGDVGRNGGKLIANIPSSNQTSYVPIDRRSSRVTRDLRHSVASLRQTRLWTRE